MEFDMEQNYSQFNSCEALNQTYGGMFTSNGTMPVECCVPGYERIIVPVLFSAIIAFGCFGNGLVLVVVLINKDYLRTTTNLFILNLATADLLFLLFCVPFHAVIYTLPSWPFGNVACKSVHLVQYASMLASVFTLIAMSVDRFLAIAYPLPTKHLRTPAKAFATSIVIWLLAIVAASPWPVFYTVRVYDNIGPVAVTVCSDDWGVHRPWRRVYFLLLFIVSYAAPLTAIVTLSALMVRQMWRLREPGRQRRRGGSASLKRRVTRLIVVVVAVFCLCWLPSHISWLWINYSRHTWRHTYAFYYFRVVAHVLSYANSAINPVIYAFLSANFQKACQRALSCRTAPPVGGSTCRRSSAVKTAGSFSGSGKSSMTRMVSF